MLSWLKLSHHRHSGQLRPHEHTSYIPLGLLLLLVGGVLSTYTVSALSPPPQSGSIGLSGTVPGKPPTVAATIKTPNDGQHFGQTPVTVTGTCPANLLVELYKNDIFAGSTPCDDKGNYSIDIDLLVGKNTLVARVYDDLNQPGPDSNGVSVYYDVLPDQAAPLTSGVDFGSAQLLLNTDAVYRGVFPHQDMNMPIDVLGGSPPYAINIQWGDSTNKVVPRGDNVGFTASHSYAKPGTYQVTLQATDAGGRVAFLTVAAIVNGQPAGSAATTGGSNTSSTVLARLLTLWPLYTSLVAVVVSFWLGERLEKHLLKVRGLLVQQ